ncbi:MAG: hypothetical protein KGI67_09395 [Pseudomonadota bacterium]|nr:hypothetical protein [Pseudomonadota bacterium]
MPSTAVNAIAVATTSLSASITGATAAIAELPQMELPQATSSAVFIGRRSARASAKLTPRVAKTVAAMPSSNRVPAAATVSKLTVAPIITTAASSSVLAAKWMPGANVHEGLQAVRSSVPMMMASTRLSSHPLAGRPVSARQLRDAAWVLREAGSGNRDHLQAGLASLGVHLVELQAKLVLPSNGAVLEAVAVGGLVAAVSDLAAASRVAAGRIVRLDCDMPTRNFWLVRHRDRRPSHAVAAFMSLAEQATSE